MQRIHEHLAAAGLAAGLAVAALLAVPAGAARAAGIFSGFGAPRGAAATSPYTGAYTGVPGQRGMLPEHVYPVPETGMGGADSGLSRAEVREELERARVEGRYQGAPGRFTETDPPPLVFEDASPSRATVREQAREQGAGQPPRPGATWYAD